MPEKNREPCQFTPYSRLILGEGGIISGIRLGYFGKQRRKSAGSPLRPPADRRTPQYIFQQKHPIAGKIASLLADSQKHQQEKRMFRSHELDHGPLHYNSFRGIKDIEAVRTGIGHQGNSGPTGNGQAQ